MEKLFELHNDERFDLVVVDTPPTRNALDFVDAPRRLTRLLDNRLFRLLMMPARTGVRAINFATQAFLRTIGKVVGSEVVSDAVTFFQAFEGMEDGFRRRAQGVQALLADDCTAFVLVTSPRRDATRETEFFAEKLGEAGIGVRGADREPHAPPVRRRSAVPRLAPGLESLYRNVADLGPAGRRRGGACGRAVGAGGRPGRAGAGTGDRRARPPGTGPGGHPRLCRQLAVEPLADFG